jgi:hypothetical protein
VRRRICQAAAALSVVPLAFGVAAAAAHTQAAPATTKVACKTSLSIAIAPGATSVDANNVQSGHEYGSATCGKLLGQGVQADRFSTDSSGIIVVKYTLYFATGTLHGTYELTAQNDSLNFTASDYVGKLTVKGGTGTYKGMTGTGTMTCSTPDGIHSACTTHLKLK